MPRSTFDNLCAITGLPIANCGDGLPIPPLGPPPSVPSVVIPQDGGRLPDPPPIDDPTERRVVNRILRGLRKTFKATARRLHGLS